MPRATGRLDWRPGHSRRSRSQEGQEIRRKKNKCFPLDLLTSFYEAVGCQAPAVLPAFERAPAGAGSSQAGARGGGAGHDPVVRTYARAVHTGRSVRSQASPDHLLSVVTVGHAPAARMRWTDGRAAPSVRRFPKEPGGQASGAHQCRRRREAARRELVRSSSGSAARRRAPRRGSRTATTRSRVCVRARQSQSVGSARRRPQTAA